MTKYEERHAHLLAMLEKNVREKNWQAVITFAVEIRVLEGQATVLRMMQRQKAAKAPNEPELHAEG